MCVNYTPSRRNTLEKHFAVNTEGLPEWKPEVWQDYAAPVIKPDHNGEREVVLAGFGLIAKSEFPPGRKPFSTMNARAETIATLPSFSRHWQRQQRCLVPMQYFCEPCYESGRAQRWKIGATNGEDFAVAGLYRSRRNPDGSIVHSFTQITVNADQHPLMSRFHPPGDEKRSLVVIPATDYDTWLNHPDPQFAAAMLRLPDAELLQAEPVDNTPEPQLSLF
jgi:putative SOS response-associated peptidase YedK